MCDRTVTGRQMKKKPTCTTCYLLYCVWIPVLCSCLGFYSQRLLREVSRMVQSFLLGVGGGWKEGGH